MAPLRKLRALPITCAGPSRIQGWQEAAMFFVFGPSGQMYRGGPENLARITSARRVNRPQALRTRGTDEAPPFSLESLLPGGAHPSGAAETAGATAPTGSANLRAHDAVSAYAQTGHPTPATRQPLSRVRDVMTPRSLTVQPDTIVNHAWQQLAEHGVAQAPTWRRWTCCPSRATSRPPSRWPGGPCLP